ncbi:MAG: tetratricopeptide repeat protein [Verrucomicrobiota bacterium]|jgi:hypothetical protein
MTPRQAIFISAVSKELKGPRQLVANTLQFLGYEPVWQDIFGTEQGDLRAMLRRQIDGCKGVVQLVGQRYGAEPPVPDEQFGRVSYTQYEALYARRRGKKVWYLLLDESFPSEKQEPEPEELRQMQAAYRRRLQADSHLFHPLNSPEALEADVLKLRDDLTRLRRGAKQWAAAVVFLLVILVGAAIWLMSGQRQLKQQNEQLKQQNAETQKNVNMLRQYVEAAIKERQEQPGQTADELQRQTDEKWAKQRGVTPKELRQEMLRIAQEVKNAPDVSTYERANAAYVTKDYNEAERLALAAVDEAEKASPPKISAAIKALELAGNSAVARTEYADALRHLRGAEKLTDRQRNPREWADVQFDIGGILYLQGNFKEAAAVAREELNERSRWAGSENLDTLCSRNNLAADLESQGRYAEAEKEYRAVLAARERLLGADHPATLLSRHNLVVALADSGQLAEAEKEERAVLAACERLRGPEHPATLRSGQSLGAVLEREGRYAEAEKQLRAVLAVQQRVLEPDHRDTLLCRSDLAAVLDDLGQHAEAEKEIREVLDLRERILGPDHVDTLRSRDILACILEFEGKHLEAETEDRRVLAIQTRVLGPEHPETLSTWEHLALVLYSQGKNPELEQELRALLAALEHRYGSEAAETVLPRQRLAYALFCEGKFAEAVTNQQKALVIAQKGTGAESHRQTLDACRPLSRYTLFARDFAGALAASDAGLALAPNDLPLLANKAHAWLFLGKTPEAEKIYMEHRGQFVDEPEKRSWEQVVLQRFDDLEKAGITHPEFARIRELLKIEAK